VQRLPSLGIDQTRAPGLPGDATRPHFPMHAFVPGPSPSAQVKETCASEETKRLPLRQKRPSVRAERGPGAERAAASHSDRRRSPGRERCLARDADDGSQRTEPRANPDEASVQIRRDGTGGPAAVRQSGAGGEGKGVSKKVQRVKKKRRVLGLFSGMEGGVVAGN